MGADAGEGRSLVVFAFTATASTLAASVAMPLPLRSSDLMRELYLKTPQRIRVAPGAKTSPVIWSCEAPGLI